MSNDINNNHQERDHNDDYSVNNNVDDAHGIDIMDRYDLETATAHLFDIFYYSDDENGFSSSDTRLAERLLQRFPIAAQTFTADGYLLLHVACGRNAPKTLIRALLTVWPDAVSMRRRLDHTNMETDGRVVPSPLHLACMTCQS